MVKHPHLHRLDSACETSGILNQLVSKGFVIKRQRKGYICLEKGYKIGDESIKYISIKLERLDNITSFRFNYTFPYAITAIRLIKEELIVDSNS